MYLKRGLDCTIPTSHYLFCFSGKVHSEFQLGMPVAHLSLRLAAFTVAFLGYAAVAAGERGQGSLPKSCGPYCRRHSSQGGSQMDTDASGQLTHAGGLTKDTVHLDQSVLLLPNEAQRSGDFFPSRDHV